MIESMKYFSITVNAIESIVFSQCSYLYQLQYSKSDQFFATKYVISEITYAFQGTQYVIESKSIFSLSDKKTDR